MTYLDLFHPDHPDWADVIMAPADAVREQMGQLNWDKVQVRQRPLPFYPGASLLVMHSSDWAPPSLFVYALQKDDTIHVLNGQSPPIHAFNSEGNLLLTPDNLFAYVQFFCFFVRGGDGPFYFVGDQSAAYLPIGLRKGTSTDALVQTQRDFQNRYQSPRTFGKSPEGKWRCSGTIVYSNAIFIADLEVQASGMVEMSNDTPVVTDLPVKIWAPIAPATETNATLH